jgi:hypothetical protein
MKMTKIANVPDKGDLNPGMAHYEGSGPRGKTCGHCLHRGYYSHDHDKRMGCGKFYQLTGHNGPAVKTHWRACKYFEEAPNAQDG